METLATVTKWSLCAVLVLAAQGLEGRARAADAPAPPAGEWERPFEGFVPGPPDDPKFGGWTRIVDADTGLPIPGALLVAWDEFISEGAVERSWPVGTGTADETGLAFVEPREGAERSHWTANAPGHAASSEFGQRPPSLMPLVRGEPAVLRLLDPMGAPVEGARVEWFDGCPHAPTLRAARTDRCGYARFEDVDPSSGFLWFATPRGTRDPVSADALFRLGDVVPDVVLEPGVVPQGIVVDRLGRPVRQVLLRATGCVRGPAVVTGPDGRFRLPAIPLEADLWVRAWDHVPDRVPLLTDRDYRHPLRIALDPWGVVEAPWRGTALRLRARLESGSPADEDCSVLVVRLADGACDEVLLERGEGHESAAQLRGETTVAPGRYWIGSRRELVGTYDVEGREIEVAPGAAAEADLVLRPRPRLRVSGTVPEGAELRLVTADGETTPVPSGPEERHVPLAAAPPAALHVEHEGATFVFPVGPARGGRREATVALPPPHRIRWPKGVQPKGVRLLHGLHEQAFEERDDGLETRAAGDLVLEADLGDGEGSRRLPLRLPLERAVDLLVDPRTAPAAPAERLATYRVVAPPGMEGRVALALTVSGGSGSMEGNVMQGSVGARLTATIPGYFPKHVVVTRAEEREIRWGTASLDLTVVGGDGAPRAARVVLDDEPFALRDGALTVAGLDSGPHRVLVAPEGEAGPAKELRLVLAEGEKRSRRVVLAP